MGFLDGIFGKKEDFSEQRKYITPGATAQVQVERVYNITGVGVVPVGKVTSGALYVGMKCNVNGKEATVKTIEANHQMLQTASAGMLIGFNLTNVSEKDIQPGVLLTFQ